MEFEGSSIIWGQNSPSTPSASPYDFGGSGTATAGMTASPYDFGGALTATRELTAAQKTSFMSNIFSGLAAPFKVAGEVIVKSAPSFASGLAKQAGQSLYDVILTKTGLVKKAQTQPDGTIVISAEKAQGGVPAPTTMILPGGQTTIGAAPRGYSMSTTTIIIMVAVVGALLIFASRAK